MVFADKIRLAREKAKLNQKELAELVGVHYRSVQNWETGGRLPKSMDTVRRLSEVLNIPTEQLLDDTDAYVVEAAERGGDRAARDVEGLVREVIGLFAGGEIEEEEKDGIMAALNEAYWVAKAKNQRYVPTKYKDADDGGEN